MENSADPDQPTDLDLHCLQRQGISEFSRTRVNSELHSANVFYRYTCIFHGYSGISVSSVTVTEPQSSVEILQSGNWKHIFFAS